jgi:glutathione peroxidase
MKRILLLIAASLLALATAGAQDNVYGFTVKDAAGKTVSLCDYKGKVLLGVNTATKCGFTPQYKELQELYDQYRDSGFEVLDFPCNQFGEQAPGTMEEIRFSSGCTGKKVSKGSATGSWQRPWTRCSDPRMPTMRQSLRSNGTLRNS